jgi:5-methylcytosine-specific restriction endonuclease McrA
MVALFGALHFHAISGETSMRVVTSEQARIRDELIHRRMQTPEQATAAVLANFRCEYCDLDFLDAQHPDNYHQWVGWDHLIPRWDGGGDAGDNLVCSCRVCNWIKHRWNPRTAFKGRSNPPSRDEMIKAARDYINNKKAKYDREVSQAWRDIVRK